MKMEKIKIKGESDQYVLAEFDYGITVEEAINKTCKIVGIETPQNMRLFLKNGTILEPAQLIGSEAHMCAIKDLDVTEHYNYINVYLSHKNTFVYKYLNNERPYDYFLLIKSANFFHLNPEEYSLVKRNDNEYYIIAK